MLMMDQSIDASPDPPQAQQPLVAWWWFFALLVSDLELGGVLG
jgi:hypothetical protein